MAATYHTQTHSGLPQTELSDAPVHYRAATAELADLRVSTYTVTAGRSRRARRASRSDRRDRARARSPAAAPAFHAVELAYLLIPPRSTALLLRLRRGPAGSSADAVAVVRVSSGPTLDIMTAATKKKNAAYRATRDRVPSVDQVLARGLDQSPQKPGHSGFWEDRATSGVFFWWRPKMFIALASTRWTGHDW